MASTASGIDPSSDDISVDHESMSSDVSVPAETISDVLKTKEWLDGQLYDQLSELQTARVEVIETTDVEVARERISKLQLELLSESSKSSLKELTLKRLQLGAALTQQLFMNDGSGDHDESRKKDLEELVLKQRQLVSTVLKEAGNLEKLRADLREVRDKNFEMKARNRESMQQIRERQGLMEEKADEFRRHKEGQRKKEQLESEITKIVIIRHTLQGLVLGSGINWAEDPAMEELLLSLGEPLNF